LLPGLLLLGWPLPGQAGDVAARTSDEERALGEQAWGETGFCLQLHLGGEAVRDSDEHFAATGLVLAIEPGYRFGHHWSAAFALRYSVLTGHAEGLRWSGVAHLTWHPLGATAVTVGLGYAGAMVNQAYTWTPPTGTAAGEASIASCEGSGGMSVVRLGYLFAVGELFATGPSVEANLQLTRCHGDVVRVLGPSTSVHYWSWYRGFELGWAFGWR
jgi:hypothetical protein